jgi:2-dehydropantoate 2-reductase
MSSIFNAFPMQGSEGTVMRILVVGAGGVGGYFGARLLQAGRDVTFLVRPSRAAVLARDGLTVHSRLGDFHHPAPPHVTGDALVPFDLILLSCKARDLGSAMEAMAPAVGPDSLILPLLNGLAHLDLLRERFGDSAVLGGLCMISADRNAEGEILHFNDIAHLVFGEPAGGYSERTRAVAATLGNAGFTLSHADNILQAMWEKWTFIATLAGLTCLMRGAVCDMLAGGAAPLMQQMQTECEAVAAQAGFPVRPAAHDRLASVLASPDSTLTASMLRDVERGLESEGEHLLGDLLKRRDGGTSPDTSLLMVACTHLRTYEARRRRGDLPGVD